MRGRASLDEEEKKRDLSMRKKMRENGDLISTRGEKRRTEWYKERKNAVENKMISTTH